MPAPQKIDVDEVVARRAAGESVRAIARALGVAPSSISRIARRPEVAERIEREHRERQIDEARVPGLGSVASSGAVWLLVRSGNWGFGSARGGSVVMRSFPAGLYLEVDEEVVALARRAGSPQLVLRTGEPPASDRIRRVRALSWEGRALVEAEVRDGAYRLEFTEGEAAAAILALDERGAPIGTVEG